MFKSFITGAVALGLAFAATPDQAKANDAIIGGAIIGALLGGTVAAIAESNHRRDYYQPQPSRRYYGGHGYRRDYRRPVVVERRYYRPAPRVVYRDYHGGHGYYRRPSRGYAYYR